MSFFKIHDRYGTAIFATVFLNFGILKNYDIIRDLDSDYIVTIIIYGIVLGLIVLFLTLKPERLFRIDRLYAGSYLFFLLMFIIYYQFCNNQDELVKTKFYLFTFVGTIAFIWPFFFLQDSPSLGSYVLTFFLLGLFLSILGLFSNLGSVGWKPLQVFDRAGSYQSLGRLAGACVLIAFAYVRKHKSIFLSYPYLLCLLILFTGLLLSATRQAVVGVFFSGIYMAWFTGVGTQKNQLIKLAIGLAVFVIVGLSIMASYQMEFNWTVTLARFGADSTVSESFRESQRPKLWAMGLELWMKNPIFGSGFGSYMEHTGWLYPHNTLIEIASEFGLVGIMLWLLVLYGPARIVFNRRKIADNDTCQLMAALWIYWIICSMFSGGLRSCQNELFYSSCVLISSTKSFQYVTK